MIKNPTKNQKWSIWNIVSVVIVYVLNYMILAGMFIFVVYNNKISVSEFFLDKQRTFNFMFLLLFMIAIFAIFFLLENRDFLRKASNSEMLFLVIELSLAICYVTGKYINPYVKPIALVAILTLFLTNNKTAIFVSTVFCIVSFLFDEFADNINSAEQYYEIICLINGITISILAVFIMRNVYSRMRCILMGFVLSLPVLIFILVPVINFGMEENRLKAVISAVCSGPLAVLCFLFFIAIFEEIFKKTSAFRLAELTNHKSKFIKKMIEETPGTFNHAIVVSNIAEMCATAIGEDALLARTCAYYHDIGKLRRPEFFKENQSNDVNPHDELTPELSANIIRSHAQDGYSLALKSGLPKIIADVCREHHGTLPILFFYDKAKRLTESDVPLANYCYVGPKPQTKIAAIIMIADGCEAAVRSLPDRSRDKVLSVVESIIQDRMKLEQFTECEITLKELNIMKYAIVSSLTGIYHKRVEYPKLNINIDELSKKDM